MRKQYLIPTVTALIAAAALSLTACSADNGATDKASGKASASATSEPSPTSTFPAESIDNKAPKTGSCDNGQITITAGDLSKDKTFTVKDACDKVSILASGASITIEHDVDAVTIEGSDNTITAKDVQRTYAVGTGNTIKHTGKTPKPVDPEHDSTTYEQR
ncbi:DUF3060 domain-containing protein [Curtobacterium flaccumfaciens]|nr:DUF3060 domain-containing protein [Curtobacterium flaccumfaciens]